MWPFSSKKKCNPKTVKVLVVFKHPKTDLPTACHEGLGVTALHLVMSLREMRIDADSFPVSNGEFLWHKLATDWSAYTHVIMCAPFIDHIFLKKLFTNFSETKFSIVYHSNLGFLSQDRFAVKSLIPYFQLEKDCPNFKVATNSIDLSQAIEQGTGQEFTYLPNLIHLPHMVRRTRSRWTNQHPLHVGLFGATRVLKNWLTAAAAVMIISRKIHTNVIFHISTQRNEGADSTVENMKDLLSMNSLVTLLEVPWLDHDDFVRYLYGMDLLMQPSFTETFNNITAEGCAAGVPSVVSDAIVWAPDNWKARTDSAVDVARVGLELLKDKDAPEDGWYALDKFNKDSEKVWQNWLDK